MNLLSLEEFSTESMDSTVVSILKAASRNADSAAYLYVFGLEILAQEPLFPRLSDLFIAVR